MLDSLQQPDLPRRPGHRHYAMPRRANVSRKPGAWQVYDIIFEGPRFKDGKLEKPATPPLP